MIDLVDRFGWNFRGNGLQRCAAGVGTSADIVGFAPGPNVGTFAIPQDPDELLSRFGRGILPDVDSIATTEPDWELTAGGGFKAPIDVTYALADDLDNGMNLVFALRFTVINGEISTHESETSGQFLGNYEHPSTPEASQGFFRVRWKIAADPRCLQTNVQWWTGSAFAQQIILHDDLTPAVVVPPGDGYIDLMVEYAGVDPAIGGVNLRLTIRSFNADGSVHLPLTHKAHFVPGVNYGITMYPRPTKAQLTSNAYFCVGRSYKLDTSSAALKGEVQILLMMVRDGSAGMMTTLADVEEALDYMINSAPIGGDQCALVARNAWTGSPQDGFNDAAVGGGVTLTENGSGTSVALGSAPIPGLPDRFRGFAITGKSLLATDQFTTDLVAAWAAGKTVVFLTAIVCNAAADDGVAHAFVEIGSNNTSVMRDRRAATTNAMNLIIREGTTGITLDYGTAEEVGMEAGLTVIRLVQISPSAPYHQDENALVRHSAVVDVLSAAGLVRGVLYPDESPANAEMLKTTTNKMSIGGTLTGANPLDGTIVLAYFTIDGGDILDAREAQDVMEGWWTAVGNGLIRATGGGAARNRSRSRARAGAF